MPGGGKLLVETRNVTLDDAYVAENPDAMVGDSVMLAVSDTGSGRAAETLARVFEPFFTTKARGKGTVLGLAMVYGFIRQSNGHIKVVSDVGRGTSFRLHLPRSDGPGEVTAAARATGMVGGNERILVVEDELRVRSVVAEQLESLGYAVSQAAEGMAGLAAFEAAAEPYDLLLTDVMMPGSLGGRGLADEVIRRWPKTRIVLMSGFAESAIARDGRLEDGTPLLSKPFHKTDLARIVRRALDSSARTHA